MYNNFPTALVIVKKILKTISFFISASVNYKVLINYAEVV